jgi:hypothetical protein
MQQIEINIKLVMEKNDTNTSYDSLKEHIGDCGFKVLVVVIGIILALIILAILVKAYFTIVKDLASIRRTDASRRREEREEIINRQYRIRLPDVLED